MNYTKFRPLSVLFQQAPELHLAPLPAVLNMRREEMVWQVSYDFPELDESTRQKIVDRNIESYRLGLQDGAVPLGALLEMSNKEP